MNKKTQSQPIERTTALCYIRQSVTKKNADKDSPERQRAMIQSYCERNNWTPEWYEDADGHKSGTKESNRKGWLALKKRLTDPDVAALVVQDQSRAMRSVWRAIKLFEELPAYGVKLHLAGMGKELDISTPDGRLNAYLQAIIDELYALDISQKVKNDVKFKKERGISVGQPPFGTIRGKDRYLIPSPHGAWLLMDGSYIGSETIDQSPEDAVWFGYYDCAKLILERYAQNKYGYNRIATSLSSEGWRFRDRWGNPQLITADVVRRVTSNWRQYAGIVGDGRAKELIASQIENPVDSLTDTGRSVMSLDLLRAVAEAQEKRSVTTRPRGSVRSAYDFPLTRLIYCAHCERIAEEQQNARARTKLMGWKQNDVLRYRHTEGLKCGCKNRTVKADLIEAQFYELVQLLGVSQDAIPLMTEIAMQSESGNLGEFSDEAELEKQKKAMIIKLNRRLETLKFLLMEGDIDEKAYTIEKENTRRDITHWQSRTTEAQKKAVELTICVKAFQDLLMLWTTASETEKQDLAHGLFEHILYDLDAQEIVGFRLHAWADSYMIVRSDLLASSRGESIEVSSNVPIFDPNGSSAHNTYHVFGGLIMAKRVYVFIVYDQYDSTPRLTLQKRNQRMQERYKEGESITELAQKYGISPQRVNQIVKPQKRSRT